MLTKEYIREIKSKDNGGIGHLISNYNDSGSLTFILENLGQLPQDFDGSFLPDLLQHKNSDVRFWTVKTMGKLPNENYLSLLRQVALTEKDTTVRREAVSSIGRHRSKKGQEILFEILQDEDPKVLSQIIRGLLVFKGDKNVDEHLKPLINHPNEMVRTVIYKEYFAEQKIKNEQPHTESYDYLKNVVVNGDTVEVMKLLKDESVHLTFTSPPYYNARESSHNKRREVNYGSR